MCKYVISNLLITSNTVYFLYNSERIVEFSLSHVVVIMKVCLSVCSLKNAIQKSVERWEEIVKHDGSQSSVRLFVLLNRFTVVNGTNLSARAINCETHSIYK